MIPDHADWITWAVIFIAVIGGAYVWAEAVVKTWEISE